MIATIKIVVVFIFLIIMIRKKVAIEWAMMLGCVLLGILFIFPPAVVEATSSNAIQPVGGAFVEFFREVLYGAIDTDCLILVVTVYTITVLGTFMDRSGHLKGLMDSLSELMHDGRYVAATVPSIIGLMPMPGGALFSCPMVQEIGKPMELSNTKMAAINFWFRHIWEYVWPLYPGLLLMSTIFQINIPMIILIQSPMAAATIIIGLLLLILPIKKPAYNGVMHTLGENFREIFFALWPLVIIIVFTMVPYPSHEAVGMKAATLTRAKLLVALVISTFFYGVFNRMDRKTVWEIIIICLKKHTIMIAFSIMIFSHLVDHTKAALQMAPFFADLGLPSVIVIFLLCFIVGMLTGLTIGYVGICFPIIVPLVREAGVADLGLMQFAFTTGFIGVMLTPVHLCFALTKEYFHAEWGKIYKLILPCAIFVLLVSLAIALIGLPNWV